MREISCLKLENDDFQVEFEIVADTKECSEVDSRKLDIAEGLQAVDAQLSANQQKIEALNKEIDRLTNHADGLDYMVAVGSGILAGLIDSFWVGAFDFQSGKAWSNKRVNDFVMDVARSQGYDGDRLEGAIRWLEDRFKIPSDNSWKGSIPGISPRSHHLDDMAHHPTPIGLFFSILTQFTHEGYFHNGEGTFCSISVDESCSTLIGHDIPSKIFAGTINWFFHLVSDMSGSNKTAGVGMGIPGPILSLLKELSAIPGLDRAELAKNVKHAFVKGRFDLRSELAVGHELTRQAVPVVLNEVIVRAFYFIRRLVKEIKEKRDFAKINWQSTLPFKNRTIVRMLTIATGTFTVVDLGDAALRAGAKTGGTPPAFAIEFLLHVNFVGVGRFAIAVGTDAYMGISRSKSRSERLQLYGQQLHLINAKAFYSQAEMWISAETTQQTISEAFAIMGQAVSKLQETMRENGESLERIGQYAMRIDEHNPGMKQDILKELEY